MRLTIFTNFALRTLMYAAMHDDRLCRAQEIADAKGWTLFALPETCADGVPDALISMFKD